MASRVTERGGCMSFDFRTGEGPAGVAADDLRALVQRFALLAGVWSRHARHFAKAPREMDPVA